MPIIQAAKKSIRTSSRRRVFNDRRRRAMRKIVKETLGFIAAKDAASAEANLPAAYKAIDKATKRGVIKANTASRKKSRLAKRIAELKA